MSDVNEPFISGLVSVVMPAYNSAATLAAAIESVLAQEYGELELYVVDDHSVDATRRLAEAFGKKDARVRVLSTDSGKGVAPARNTALRRCRGEFVAFIDADDRWDPEKLRVQLAALSDSGLALAATSYRVVDQHGADCGLVRIDGTAGYDDLLKGNVLGCSTVVVDRTRTGTFLMPEEVNEDYLTWLALTKEYGPALCVRQVLATYTKSSASLSGSKLRAAQWQWRVYREVLKFSAVRSAYLFAHYACRGVGKHFFSGRAAERPSSNSA